MLHARGDYQERIQDSAGLIPEDEPVFLLRAQDASAPWTVRMWIDEARKLGAKANILEAARLHVETMIKWQREHGMKIPDMPEV